jgi:hypothetical protein
VEIIYLFDSYRLHEGCNGNPFFIFEIKKIGNNPTTLLAWSCPKNSLNCKTALILVMFLVSLNVLPHSPLCIATIRSLTSTVCNKSWLDTSITLGSARSLIIFLSRNCVVGSKFAKGSSRIITSGFPISVAMTYFLVSFDKSRKYFVF